MSRYETYDCFHTVPAPTQQATYEVLGSLLLGSVGHGVAHDSDRNVLIVK